MPAIDYVAIRNAIVSVLENDAGCQALGLSVYKEEYEDLGLDHVPYACVYLVRRGVTQSEQKLSALTQWIQQVDWAVLIGHGSIDGTLAAIELRDAVLAAAELALLKNPKLNGTCDWALLEGGPVDDGQDERGHLARGMIRLRARVQLTTT